MTEELVLGGKRALAATGATFAVTEPATAEDLAEVAEAGVADVDAAVSTATTAFETRSAWATDATARGRTLTRVAALLAERTEELATLEARNAGHPIAEARWEVDAAARTFEYYGGAANKHLGQTVPVSDVGLDVVVHEPVGPCALIVPWNFPLMIAAWKVAPALACGNPVILKPASLTPLSALALGDILVEAGVPADHVSVLAGPGSSVGGALVGDPRVAKIGFTGETATGSQILAASAPHVARVSLELGGKSAAVVFADADLERCAAETPFSVFGNAGQDCCARSRILVEAPVYEDFVAAFDATSTAIRVGEPTETSTEMGPMISAGQRDRALEYLDIGRGEGARLVNGGEKGPGTGWYLTPAVVADVDNDMRIAQEEIFGPVASLIPFRDEAEAVRLANDSPYGLSGSIWTGDGARAIRLSQAIRAGALSVNTNRSVRVETPFGGYKRSGLGRELGMAAMDTYSETKNVFYSAES